MENKNDPETSKELPTLTRISYPSTPTRISFPPLPHPNPDFIQPPLSHLYLFLQYDFL